MEEILSSNDQYLNSSAKHVHVYTYIARRLAKIMLENNHFLRHKGNLVLKTNKKLLQSLRIYPFLL